MEVKIICTNPVCQQHIALDDSYRGRSVQCPTCNTTMRVPGTPPKGSPAPRGSSSINLKKYLPVWGSITAVVLIAGAIAACGAWQRHRRAGQFANRRQEIARQQGGHMPSWAGSE